MNIATALEQRQREGRSIRVGLVGVGQMGAGFVAQTSLMKGMDVVVTADVDLQRAVSAFRAIGLSEDAIVILPADAPHHYADEAIAAGKRVVTTNASLVTAITAVDAVVEATGIPSIGALVAYRSILARRHVVMLNVETESGLSGPDC